MYNSVCDYLCQLQLIEPSAKFECQGFAPEPEFAARLCVVGGRDSQATCILNFGFFLSSQLDYSASC